MNSQKNSPSEKQTIKKEWLGTILRDYSSSGRVKIRLNWRRIGVYAIALVTLAWLGKSFTLLYFFENVRNYKDVSFTDAFMFPLNRSSLRQAQGEYQIKEGLAAIENQEYRNALMLLRSGLARDPLNIEGRKHLASIYASWRPQLAIDILVEGKEKGIRDNEYDKLLIDFYFENKDDSKVLEAVNELLAQENLEAETVKFAKIKKIQSNIAMGNLKLAAKLLTEEETVKDSLDGIILGTELMNKVGERDKAVDLLKQIIDQVPDKPLDVFFALLFRYLSKEDRWDEYRKYALQYVTRKPLEWQPRIFLIESLHRSNMSERRDNAINRVIKDYSSEIEAMTQLGAISGKLGLTQPATRLYSLALRENYPIAKFSLFLLSAFSNSDNPRQAVSMIDELVEDSPDWLEEVESEFNIIQSLLYHKLGDNELGSLYYSYLKESRKTTSVQLITAATEFKSMGFQSLSIELLEEVYQRNPSNHQVLAELTNQQLQAGNTEDLSKRLTSLLKMRRPSYDLIDQILNKFQSDQFIFTNNRTQLISKLKEVSEERQNVNTDIWQKNEAS